MGEAGWSEHPEEAGARLRQRLPERIADAGEDLAQELGGDGADRQVDPGGGPVPVGFEGDAVGEADAGQELRVFAALPHGVEVGGVVAPDRHPPALSGQDHRHGRAPRPVADDEDFAGVASSVIHV